MAGCLLSYYLEQYGKKEGYFIFKKTTYVLTACIIVIAVYGFSTNNNSEILPAMLLVVSLLTLVRSVESFQKNDKLKGWLNLALFLFVLFVSIQGFLLRYGFL